MKRIGLFLFFCILSLHGIAQVENDKDTLIIRQDKINEFINEMNEADKSMDFINEPPTLTPPVLSDTLRMPKFDLTPQGIIEYLKLREPIFSKTTNYGHFGREGFTWEEFVQM
jgi:hypothetical protein